MFKIFVPSVVFFTAIPGIAVEVFFTPGEDCENKIIEALSNAKKEIRTAVYSINNKKIVDAIKAAYKRGIKIRILTDRLQAAGRSSRVFELQDFGLDVRLHSKHKIEHNKFVVTDDTLAVSGSYNWTEPASKANSENCIVMPEANAVASYTARFDDLWNQNSAEKSLEYSVKIKSKKREKALSAKALNQEPEDDE